MPAETLKYSEPLSQVPPLSRLKVLHLIGSFHQGGSERQALQLARLLHRDATYDVRLASIDPSGSLREHAESLGLGEIPSYPLTSFYNWQFLVQLRRFAAHLTNSEISVVHTHDFYTNIFGMAAAALAGVPVRIASRRDLGMIRSSAQCFVEQNAYRLAHRVIANSEAVRRQLIEEGVPARKIAVIYNGQDLERVTVSPGLDRKNVLAALGLGRASDPRVVLIVANFRLAVKDQGTFLRAAQRVQQQMPNTLFVLAGEGDLQDSMRKLAEELGLKDSAAFIGRCDRIGELLAVSDVCVLSSRSEGFSNAILEYMAAGRPVVATDVGGAGESIIEGETGFLVPAGDDAIMAQRILTLLESEDKANQMGRRGRDRVEQNFSLQRQLERTQEVYAELLSRTRA